MILWQYLEKKQRLKWHLKLWSMFAYDINISFKSITAPIYRVYSCFTLETIVATAFGRQINIQRGESDEFSKAMDIATKGLSSGQFENFILFDSTFQAVCILLYWDNLNWIIDQNHSDTSGRIAFALAFLHSPLPLILKPCCVYELQFSVIW